MSISNPLKSQPSTGSRASIGGDPLSDSAVQQLGEDASSQVKTVQGQISDATASLTGLTDSLKQVTASLTDLVKQLDPLQLQIASIQDQLKNPNLSDSQKKSLEDDLKSLNTKATLLSLRIAAKLSRLSDLKTQVSDKQKELSKLQDHDLPAAQAEDAQTQSDKEFQKQADDVKKAQDAADAARTAAAAAVTSAARGELKHRPGPLDIDYSQEK